MARTTPAQNPRGFKRRTRFVVFAVSFLPRLGESKVIVVTYSVYLVLPWDNTRPVPLQMRLSSCPIVTFPQCVPSATELASSTPSARQGYGGGFNRRNSKQPSAAASCRRQLTPESRLCLLITADMAAVARQGRHTLCVLAVRGTELLTCGRHAITCHMSAFDRCVRHQILLKWFNSGFPKRPHSTRLPGPLARVKNANARNRS